jgi:hypothetical protein
MRASRQTELQREFPLHVVCSWLGNSPRIAQQSYLLVTEDDFARAAGARKVMVAVNQGFLATRKPAVPNSDDWMLYRKVARQ